MLIKLGYWQKMWQLIGTTIFIVQCENTQHDEHALSGGMPSQENVASLSFWDQIWK